MTTRSIVMWNLETFGRYPLRGNDDLVMWFIAEMQNLQSWQADVVIIQELRESGRLLLPAAAQAVGGLFNPWQYDYLPGAITPSEDEETADQLTFANLSYIQSANFEGYGILARPGVLVPFETNHSWLSTLKNGNGTGLLNLQLTGVKADLSGGSSAPIKPADGNEMVDADFPLPSPGQVAEAEPTKTLIKRVAKTKAQTQLQTNKKPPLSWAGCRRPARVKMNLDGGATIDVLCYHAPADAYGSVYGTLAFGLCQQLWELDQQPYVVLGGDFNTFSNDSQQTGFQNIYAAGFRPGTGEYDKNGKITGYQPSMVRYTVDNKGKKLLDADDPCLGNPRDFLFYSPKIPNDKIKSSVWQLYDILKSTDNVQKNRGICSCVQQAMQGRLKANDLIPGESDVIQQLLKIFDRSNPGKFTDNRSIAYFYRNFISDHLPVYCSINF